jgi:hypothetical protein
VETRGRPIDNCLHRLHGHDQPNIFDVRRIVVAAAQTTLDNVEAKKD